MIPITSVINLIFLGLLAFYIHKRVKSQPLGIYFLPGLLLKCAAGIILGLLYLVYYQGGDTVLFHEDATFLARVAIDTPNEYLRVLFFNDRSTDLWDTLLLVDQPRGIGVVLQELLKLADQGGGVLSELIDLSQYQLRVGEVSGIQRLSLLQVSLRTVQLTQIKVTLPQLGLG